ncbi:MAG: ribosome biogenesis GTP-binding protein YihA/YsxC, partial [Pseudomonadota bacterium]
MSIKFQQMAFIQSASTVLQCPRDGGTEIALIGRSNAGKSSALNILANQKNLAKTSKQPGYTRLINLFSVDENRRLVDLPGYGYAKVSQALKADMERVINEYIHERRCLYGVLVLMDIRHPLQEGDIACIETLLEAHKKVHVIL